MKPPTNEERKRFYHLVEEAFFLGAAALSQFGESEQELRALEELAELQVALLHWTRDHEETTRADVASEVADVLIVAIQTAMRVGMDETIDALALKTHRLADLIREVET